VSMPYPEQPLPDQGIAPDQGAPPDQGVPPELAALLGGGGDPAEAEPAPSDPPDILRQMLELASDYRSVEEDDEDLLSIEKVTTLIQQLLAKQQKEADGMLQGKASPRAMRRAYAA
jgi:hypothetical protein